MAEGELSGHFIRYVIAANDTYIELGELIFCRVFRFGGGGGGDRRYVTAE